MNHPKRLSILGDLAGTPSDQYARYYMCLFLPLPQGGTHVNYVVDQVVSKLLEAAKKRNRGGMDLKPFHIKGHLWVFVNCLIENPTFDSQTKENMTLKAKSFGSTCVLNEKFIKQVGENLETISTNYGTF